MKKLTLSVALAVATVVNAFACTNLIVGKNASADGSTIVSYSADSYGLFGELYHYPAGMHKKGTWIDVHEWDTGKYLGRIEQARQTYNVIGNMNEFQLTIGETTFGGRPELVDTDLSFSLSFCTACFTTENACFFLVCDGRIILFWLGGENYSFYICMH